jgi:cysteine desulfurase family protein
MIYLDNAATSFPKPDIVYEAMDTFARKCGGSGTRSGHTKSLEAESYIDLAREWIMWLVNSPSPAHVCFAANATEALNTVIFGLAKHHAKVVTTSVEHNAVTRPLRQLWKTGCSIRHVKADETGACGVDDLVAAVRDRPDLVIMTHANNVTGALNPILPVAEECKALDIPLVVDASQTAGCCPIDASMVPVVAFTGHKGLLGPQGTGGFVIHDYWAERMAPRRFGGTGSQSDLDDQPDTLPGKFEAGTLNGHGLAGLATSVRHVVQTGVNTIRKHEMSLWQRLRFGLSEIDGVELVGPADPAKAVGIVSFTVAGQQPTDVGFALDAKYNIMCRTGLHCAPACHHSIGTMPLGTVRFSIGWANTTDDIDLAVSAVREVVTSGRTGSQQLAAR